MANKGGLHIPNGEMSISDWNIALNLGLSNVNFLHYQRWVAKPWRAKYPDGIIHCRFYLPNWSAIFPSDWAEECAEIYLQKENGVSLSDLGVHVTPANEMNLALEGGGWSRQDYININSWLVLWYKKFVSLTGIPNDRTHFPAFAFGHSDDQDDLGYIGNELCRQAIEMYGWLNKHPYFLPNTITSKWYGHRFILDHERFPSKPIFCSEGGFADERWDVTQTDAPNQIATHLDSLKNFPYVKGITYFIFRDPTLSHKRNDWGLNRRIEEYIKSIKWPEITVIDFKMGFKDFADGLVSIGADPGTPIEKETPLVSPDDYMVTRQRTTTGTMLWIKEQNDMVMWMKNKKIYAYNGGNIKVTK